jgi:hypothetical protein
MWSALRVSPINVWVLPLPVCPYATTVADWPRSTACTAGNPHASNTAVCSCALEPSNTPSQVSWYCPVSVYTVTARASASTATVDPPVLLAEAEVGDGGAPPTGRTRTYTPVVIALQVASSGQCLLAVARVVAACRAAPGLCPAPAPARASSTVVWVPAGKK